MATNEGSGGVENLLKALRCTQELRASVSAVFDKLSSGLKVDEASTEKDKVYLSDLRECLTAVNTDVELLEKVASTVQSPQLPFTLSTPGHMTLDPFLDKTPYYHEITKTYKWSSKTQNHATLAAPMLHSNLPKRSIMFGVPSAKRTKRPMSVVCSVPPANIDLIVQQCSRYFPDMNIQLSHPAGNPAVIQVTVGRTMKALIVLRGLAIEWVVVKAFHEDFSLENGKGIDLWSSSKHLVFQKITQHARSASLAYSVTVNDLTLRQFLGWLNTYKTLFSASCQKCGKMLQNYLPPTWHDSRTSEAYHEHCRP